MWHGKRQSFFFLFLFLFLPSRKVFILLFRTTSDRGVKEWIWREEKLENENVV